MTFMLDHLQSLYAAHPTIGSGAIGAGGYLLGSAASAVLRKLRGPRSHITTYVVRDVLAKAEAEYKASERKKVSRMEARFIRRLRRHDKNLAAIARVSCVDGNFGLIHFPDRKPIGGWLYNWFDRSWIGTGMEYFRVDGKSYSDLRAALIAAEIPEPEAKADVATKAPGLSEMTPWGILVRRDSDRLQGMTVTRCEFHMPTKGGAQ